MVTSKTLLHVPRNFKDSKELAESGYYQVYLTDYPLTPQQRIDLAVAVMTMEEDRVFFEQVLELASRGK